MLLSLAVLWLLSCLITPVAAFGAGSLEEGDFLYRHAWRHGDIVGVLHDLPVSFLTGYRFTKLERMQVYFGNWLRDYSQLIDITPLTKAAEPVLRAVVSPTLRSARAMLSLRRCLYLAIWTLALR